MKRKQISETKLSDRDIVTSVVEEAFVKRSTTDKTPKKKYKIYRGSI